MKRVLGAVVIAGVLVVSTLSFGRAQVAATCASLIAGDAMAIASGREAGASVTVDNLQESLNLLSGEIPLPDERCLGNRCTMENRLRTRKFLYDRLLSFGFSEADIELEAEQEKRYGFGSSSSYGSSYGSSYETSSYGYSSYASSSDYDSPKNVETAKADETSGKKKKKKKGAGDADVVEAPEKVTPAATEVAEDGYKKFRGDIVNLVATVRGSKYPDEVIEVSAHYDTVHDNAPGADDNGSGVATILEVARAVRKLNPDRTIRIVFADLEEMGMKGTEMHVRRLADRKGEKFLGAIVVDTIGFFPKSVTEKPKFVVEVGEAHHHRSRAHYESAIRFANSVLDQMKAFERHADGTITLSDSLPSTADHGPYWRGGYAAVLVAAIYENPYINPGYHKTTDKVDNIDWVFFQSIAQQVVEAIVRLGEAPAQPTPAFLPDARFLADNRDHIAVEVARLAEVERAAAETRRREREAFLAKQEADRRTAQAARDAEFKLAAERRAEDYRVAQSRLPWDFSNVNIKAAEYLGLNIQSQAVYANGIFASLKELLTGPAEPKQSVDTSALSPFPLFLFQKREAHAEPTTYTVPSHFDDATMKLSLEKFAPFFQRTIEIIPTDESMRGVADSGSQIRVGGLLISIRSGQLDVREYHPRDVRGSKGFVLYAGEAEVRWALFRLARYLRFNRSRDSFYQYSSPYWSGYVPPDLNYRISAYHTADEVLLKAKLLGEEKKKLWLVDEQSGFRLRAYLDDPIEHLGKASLLAQVSRPQMVNFGASVLRDVFGFSMASETLDRQIPSLEQELFSDVKYAVAHYPKKIELAK